MSDFREKPEFAQRFHKLMTALANKREVDVEVNQALTDAATYQIFTSVQSFSCIG
jgi:hypothetical protein